MPAAGRVITIDGPAGTGKSSVASQLAQRLGWSLLDTGAMYRAVALAALRQNQSLDDGPNLAPLLATLRFSQRNRQFLLNDEDVSQAIRTPQIAQAASRVARHFEVRSTLVHWQRQLAENADLVTEGRDQGTIVFPRAVCKFFLTASPEARALRRFRELQASDASATYESVLAEQRERDARDSSRDLAPLAPATDALIVDTTSLPLDQVADFCERWARAHTLENQPTPSANSNLAVVENPDTGKWLAVAGSAQDAQTAARQFLETTRHHIITPTTAHPSPP